MNHTIKVNDGCSKRGKITLLSIVIFMGLFTLDIIFKGQVYQRFPIRWQHALSKKIGK